MTKIIDTDGGTTVYLERCIVELRCPVCGQQHTTQLTDYIEVMVTASTPDGVDWNSSPLCQACTSVCIAMNRTDMTAVERLRQARKVWLLEVKA